MVRKKRPTAKRLRKNKRASLSNKFVRLVVNISAACAPSQREIMLATVVSVLALGQFECPSTHNDLNAFVKNVLENGQGAIAHGCCDAKKIDCYQAGCKLARSGMQCCGATVAEDIYFFLDLLSRGVRVIAADFEFFNEPLTSLLNAVDGIPRESPEAMKSYLDSVFVGSDIDVLADTDDLVAGVGGTLIGDTFENENSFDAIAKLIDDGIRSSGIDRWIPTVCRSYNEEQCSRLGLEYCDLDTARALPVPELGALLVAGAMTAGGFIVGISRKGSVGIFYCLLLVPLLLSFAIIFDREVDTPYQLGSDADARWRIQVAGAVAIVASCLHAAIVAVHGGLVERRAQLSDKAVASFWGVAFILGIVAVAMPGDTLGPAPEKNDNCVEAGRSLFYCGSGYGIAVSAISLSLAAVVIAVVSVTRSARDYSF